MPQIVIISVVRNVLLVLRSLLNLTEITMKFPNHHNSNVGQCSIIIQKPRKLIFHESRLVTATDLKSWNWYSSF